MERQQETAEALINALDDAQRAAIDDDWRWLVKAMSELLEAHQEVKVNEPPELATREAIQQLFVKRNPWVQTAAQAVNRKGKRQEPSKAKQQAQRVFNEWDTERRGKLTAAKLNGAVPGLTANTAKLYLREFKAGGPEALERQRRAAAFDRWSDAFLAEFQRRKEKGR